MTVMSNVPLAYVHSWLITPDGRHTTQDTDPQRQSVLPCPDARLDALEPRRPPQCRPVPSTRLFL